MNPSRSKLTKVVALILVASLSQVFVHTGAAQGTPPQTTQSLGKLFTSGDRDILVDKEKANTGTTILDGAELETPDCATATVQIGQLDVVHLATNTIAVINYSDGQLKVTLKKGCVRLWAGQSTEGTVVTPDGKVTTALQPDATNRKRVEVCYPDGSTSEFDPTCAGGLPMGWIISGIGLGGLLTIVGIAAAGSAGDNPSDSAPF